MSLALTHNQIPSLELWGGVECSIVRIGDQFRDEFAETGHYIRIEDLERIAELGIRTVRYPILWEQISPLAPDIANWSWHDERMAKLRELGVDVIVGLVHHGSGPSYTDLLDPAFASGVAKHAAQVARRYPWVRSFTPINEPLTTARFSGLYGHWYPHLEDEASFLRMLFNQCQAVALAMVSIRDITPGAQLVQTEDLGRVFSTPQLQYQADYENERRWLSWDLLCGKVTTAHPFHHRFVQAGITKRSLEQFVHQPTPPDVLGVNHYLTSERYLDHAWWHYPAEFRARNGQQEYADVEAVRIVALEEQTGPAHRLREAAQRYAIPIAMTEVHHASSPEEQARWLLDIWQAGLQLRNEGIDLRAITVWSMLGAVDWNSLLTRDAKFYEPGVFDVRHSPPTPTLLAELVRELCAQGASGLDLALPAGWWTQPERFYRHLAPERRAV